jgi:hypothetical protein
MGNGKEVGRMRHFLGAIPSGRFLTQVQVAGMHLARSGMSVYAIAIVAIFAVIAVATVAFAIRRQIRIAGLLAALMLLGFAVLASPIAALAMVRF